MPFFIYWAIKKSIIANKLKALETNDQGDCPRSMRSLAINYQILLSSLDNTIRFSCLLSRSGDPWRGPSNWGLGTKDTQAHTPTSCLPVGIMVVYGWIPLTPSIGPRGGKAWHIWQWSTRNSTQGMAKIWETTSRHDNQLARPSWDVVNPGFG